MITVPFILYDIIRLGWRDSMENILSIIRDSSLDYRQKKHQLAAAAENMLPYVKIKEKSAEYLKNKVLCDIFEGHGPYRPRYILPDYKKFMENGSEYLNLETPRDMYEAVNYLLILYSHVPSITGYPVYLGQVDELLEPFVDTVSEKEFEKLLRMFLINIDRTLPDAFVHMNIGPKDTKVGRAILKLEKELKKAVPNISLKYNEETPEDFAKLAIDTALEIGKPYFVNHNILCESEFGQEYGVASCYNTLKVGGGSYTLVRLNLKEVAKLSKDYEDFINNKLKDAVDSLADVVNARARFVVEEAKFFESSFLAREGLIDIKNFTSMAAVFGLYECVEILSGGLKMGFDSKANEMAEEIIAKAYEYVKSYEGVYCYATNGKLGFHAQSGIDCDVDVTAGVRIKIGQEPQMFEQIKLEGSLQKYFDTGVSDIYIFDSTAKNNLDGILKIIKGAHKKGIKIFALNTSDSEFVRITGYLVKKCDVEKYYRGEQLREGTVKLGAESIKNNKTLNRKVRNSNEGSSE
jgi:YjjI family glycine radical enzyme